MNSLIILPQECVAPTLFVLRDQRARYAVETHELAVGVRCKIGVLGGGRGEAQVVRVDPLEVVLEGETPLPARPRTAVSLIVGVSRPQTVKKVVQAASMLGVVSLDFVRSELGEKSYLHSNVLEPAQLEAEGCKALEQVWDTQLPQVRVHRTFAYFMRQWVPQLGGAEWSRLLAQPGAAPLRPVDCAQLSGGAVLAIGPERGWSEGEVRQFEESGFRPIGLGERVVRVEVALLLLLGQLQLLGAE
jgi:RsmE family RNA methyltransferase